MRRWLSILGLFVLGVAWAKPALEISWDDLIDEKWAKQVQA